jgi:hypothetical protein
MDEQQLIYTVPSPGIYLDGRTCDNGNNIRGNLSEPFEQLAGSKNNFRTLTTWVF